MQNPYLQGIASGLSAYQQGGTVPHPEGQIPNPNQHYPLANIARSSYAAPLLFGKPTELVGAGDDDVRVDPFTGEETFADGGVVDPKFYMNAPAADGVGDLRVLPARPRELLGAQPAAPIADYNPDGPPAGIGGFMLPPNPDNYYPTLGNDALTGPSDYNPANDPYMNGTNVGPSPGYVTNNPKIYNSNLLPGSYTSQSRPSNIGGYMDYLNQQFAAGPAYKSGIGGGGGGGGGGGTTTWAKPEDFPVTGGGTGTGGSGGSGDSSGINILGAIGAAGGIANFLKKNPELVGKVKDALGIASPVVTKEAGPSGVKEQPHDYQGSDGQLVQNPDGSFNYVAPVVGQTVGDIFSNIGGLPNIPSSVTVSEMTPEEQAASAARAANKGTTSGSNLPYGAVGQTAGDIFNTLGINSDGTLRGIVGFEPIADSGLFGSDVLSEYNPARFNYGSGTTSGAAGAVADSVLANTGGALTDAELSSILGDYGDVISGSTGAAGEAAGSAGAGAAGSAGNALTLGSKWADVGAGALGSALVGSLASNDAERWGSTAGSLAGSFAPVASSLGLSQLGWAAGPVGALLGLGVGGILNAMFNDRNIEQMTPEQIAAWSAAEKAREEKFYAAHPEDLAKLKAAQGASAASGFVNPTPGTPEYDALINTGLGAAGFNPPTFAAGGGIHSGLGSLPEAGEYAAGGKLLRGPGDGMSDSIPAVIKGQKPQRAALADGEFVIPADVVSHLGNGSTEAGSKRLYDMMDKVRHARTGNKMQGRKINPDKFLPG